jgi:hypothetical protein
MDKVRDFNSSTIHFIECLRESVDNFSAADQKSTSDTAGASRNRTKPISLITNVETDTFPDISKLEAEEVASLCNEVSSLLYTYNFCVILPKELPAKQKYKLLRDIWDEAYEYAAGQKTYVEFCDCDPECCPFPLNCCQCNNFNGFDDFYDDTTIIF